MQGLPFLYRLNPINLIFFFDTMVRIARIYKKSLSLIRSVESFIFLDICWNATSTMYVINSKCLLQRQVIRVIALLYHCKDFIYKENTSLILITTQSSSIPILYTRQCIQGLYIVSIGHSFVLKEKLAAFSDELESASAGAQDPLIFLIVQIMRHVPLI